MKKKAEENAQAAELARQTLRALTGRKTYYSLDTEFGVLTVEEAPKQPARPPRRNGKWSVR